MVVIIFFMHLELFHFLQGWRTLGSRWLQTDVAVYMTAIAWASYLVIARK